MGHKKKYERYELRQFPTYSTQLLKYNPMANNVKNIYNVYL
jgi:hypothetical protein